MARVKKLLTEYTVEGTGKFPIDMLRYDGCWPAQEIDSRILLQSGKRRVVLLSNNHPTRGRWLSYQWRVIALGNHREDITSISESIVNNLG